MTITIVMFIVFFLFQFSNVALESWNHYEENAYMVDTSELPDRSDAYYADGSGEAEDFAGEARKSAVYIGDDEDAVTETVKLWADYTKRRLQIYPSLEAYEKEKKKDDAWQPQVMAIDADGMDFDTADTCKLLEEYLQAGTHLIFCNLPDVSVIKENERLQELLGIRTIRAEEMSVTDLHLHGGFLLGGEKIYSAESAEEGLEFTLPWYELIPETELYMNGIPKKKSLGDETIEEKAFPAVIWQRDVETASVFAVNGAYMEDAAGLGILSAMSAKMEPYGIYPVVNAQTLVYANYPGVADENKEMLMERYSQSMEGFFQNVVWPDVVAVLREAGATLSCMMAPQFDYEDDTVPDVDQFIRYMKLLNEQGAETGLSGVCHSDTPLAKKTARDYEFMQKALPTFQFTSFFAGDLTEKAVLEALQEDLLASVRTVVEDTTKEDKEVIGYLSDYITRQSAVIDGFEDQERREFRFRCLETALGYTSVLVDMERIVYPEDDGDEWVFASNTLRRNLQDYQIREQGFDGATVSECDERIRSFLALDYTEQREFNSIHLERNAVRGPVWFVLRTNHEGIESMEGGSWKKLEEDAYLIEMEEQKAVITLRAY